MQTRRSSKSPLTSDEDAQQIEGKAASTSWTLEEEHALLNFFCDQKDQMVAGATFKDPVFNLAAEHVKPFLKRGAVKTGRICKSKWGRVWISSVYSA